MTDAADKVPIPAAQVTVTGTTIGALSNDSGVFALRLPSDAKSLTVRRIGYRQTTVPVTPGQTDITIALDKDVLKLEQQVITGVATTVSSRNAANDVAVVTSAQVNEVPAPTVENALQGKVAGAIIQSNNGGAPGGGLQVQIRGITSINGNAEPLYVVDGVIVNNETINNGLNAINNSGGGQNSVGQFVANAPSFEDSGVNRIADINPSDIESIEVLKGASASAIYGSKASAGVVIITTKHGKAGKAQWNASTRLGHYEDAKTLPLRTFPTLQSAQDWYWNDDPVAQGTYATKAEADKFIQSVYAGPQDFQSQLFGNKQASYEADVSVSGTQGQTQYYLSGTSKYDNGIENNTGYNKQSIRSNLSQDFSSNFKVSANLSYVHDNTRRGVTGNDNIGISPYNVFSTTPQFVRLTEASNGLWPNNPFGNANPLADAALIATPENVSRFIGGGTLDWTIFQQEHQTLKITAIGGVDLTSMSDLLYAPPTLQVEQLEPSGLPGTSVSNSATINYFNYAFNLAHHWTGLSWLDATTSFGYTRDRRSTLNPYTTGANLLTGVNSPTVGTVQTNFLFRTAQLDQSWYGQEQLLLLDSRLALTAGVTGERSTSDGVIDKFYYYPRFSASFRVPEFTKAINELKFRVAYGQSGNLPIYGAKYTPYVPTQDDGLNGVSGNSLHGDAGIRPEAETEIETGFDLTVFDSRAQLSATVYQKRLSDLLLFAPEPPSIGYTQAWFNGGQFTNQGIELTLQFTPIQSRALGGISWVSNNTFYRNYSRVDALPTPPGPIGNTYGFGEGFMAVGRSVSEIVNAADILPNGLPAQVGDFQAAYRVQFGNEINIGPVRLYGLIDWSRGGNTINLTDLYFDGAGLQLWGDSAAAAKRFNKFLNNPTGYVLDGSFVKVRQLSAAYTLPTSWFAFARGRITSAKLSLTAYNVFNFYKYDGLDPELSTNGNQQVTRGQEITNYPPARSYFIGLDLGF
ncbi:MAG TPA: SusC/RagA family TonB-linked outer membrane protein [Gemmatimonadaceae bacterium]|nr:SusC/RagA family TonB-linked outer membrane protein [Gemmatimonadaceae bacterium]